MCVYMHELVALSPHGNYILPQKKRSRGCLFTLYRFLWLSRGWKCLVYYWKIFLAWYKTKLNFSLSKIQMPFYKLTSSAALGLHEMLELGMKLNFSSTISYSWSFCRSENLIDVKACFRRCEARKRSSTIYEWYNRVLRFFPSLL